MAKKSIKPKRRKKAVEHRLAHTAEDRIALRVFATNLRLARMGQGYSQTGFAKAVGCTIKQVSHVELADNWPSVSVLRKMYEVLGLPKLALT